MNNKFYPWAMSLQAPLPSQNLPSQPMSWEQYQAIKKKTADEVRKSNKRKSSRKSYYRRMNDEEKYEKRKIRTRMNKQRWRAAKKEEGIKKKENEVAEVLASWSKK